MSRRLLATVATICALGGASLAHAQTYKTVDLSPFVNQSLPNGWSINGGSTLFNLAYDGAAFDILGATTKGNLGSNVPFFVASDGSPNYTSFWYGLDDGVGNNNLFAGDPNNPHLNAFTMQVDGTGINSVYTLADNTFGREGALEYQVVFHGAGGDITGDYIGGYNTKDYNTPNCATTGCDVTPGATDWYFDGTVVYQQVQWYLPQNFGLTSITFNQVDNVDGAILMGVTLGTPEPSTWALLIAGFGMTGAALRRRRNVLA